MTALRFLLAMMLLLLLLVAVPIRNRDLQPLRPAQAQPAPAALQGRDFVYYVVQPGDTLSGLERKFRVPSSSDILDMNPEISGDHLTAGKRIKIPI